MFLLIYNALDFIFPINVCKTFQCLTSLVTEWVRFTGHWAKRYIALQQEHGLILSEKPVNENVKLNKNLSYVPEVECFTFTNPWRPFTGREPEIVTLLLAGTEPIVLVFPSLQEARRKHLLSVDTTHKQLLKCIENFRKSKWCKNKQ